MISDPARMRIGLLLPTTRFDSLRRRAQRAEELGFDLVALGDSPLAYRELYSSMAVLALHTERIRLATTVTNVVTRDLTVIASGIATLNEMSGGRLTLGLATGDSAVKVAGRQPVTLSVLEQSVATLRRLIGGGEGSGGASLRWEAGEVPIWLAAEGPRSLAVAARCADGVLAGGGIDDSSIAAALDVLAASEGAGISFEPWFFARAHVGGDPAEAEVTLASGLAASAHRTFRVGASRQRVPDVHRDGIERLVSEYVVDAHLDGSGNHNGRLVGELGLFDYLADRFAVVGTVEQCAARVRHLRQLGVGGLVFSAAVPDVDGLIERLGAVIAALDTDASPDQMTAS